MRIAAPSHDTPTCLDSTGKGKVIDFFVVSEELYSFVKTVAVDERPTVMRTHRWVVLTLEGVKREIGPKAMQACQASKACTSGPLRKPPSCAELIGMISECGQRNHSDAVVRTTLDEAALQWGRTVETEVLG